MIASAALTPEHPGRVAEHAWSVARRHTRRSAGSARPHGARGPRKRGTRVGSDCRLRESLPGRPSGADCVWDHLAIIIIATRSGAVSGACGMGGRALEPRGVREVAAAAGVPRGADGEHPVVGREPARVPSVPGPLGDPHQQGGAHSPSCCTGGTLSRSVLGVAGPLDASAIA
jgi:hypothetical protein